MKCYGASLERLVEEKTYYKGKGKLIKSMRKKAARCAIKMRSAHSNKEKAEKLLRGDLRNGPYHCFGDYNTDYCKVQKTAKKQSSVNEHAQSQSESTNNATHTEMNMTTDILEVPEQEQRLCF